MGSLSIINSHEELLMDRMQAAEMLNLQLSDYTGYENSIVLGIPRGGIVIASIIAEYLNADLDIILSRKIRAPLNPELAAGAVSEEGKLYLNQQIVDSLGISKDYITREKNIQLNEIKQRQKQYRQVSPKKSLENMVVILTDDGVATGATMQAAIWTVIAEFPEKLILAIPVSPPDTLQKLARDADDTICLCASENFRAISQFYKYFEQVEDEKVMEILKKYSKVKK